MFEESDEISDGIFMSHFELYLSSMKNINAKTDKIEAIVDDVSKNKPKSFDKYNLEPECYSFLEVLSDPIEGFYLIVCGGRFLPYLLC